MKYLVTSFFLLIISNHLYSQAVWSKTWNAGGTDMTNKIKSSHVINDTIYYVTFNVCNYNGQTWNECNSIGMMDIEGNILHEKLFENISIKEGGSIPWTI